MTLPYMDIPETPGSISEHGSTVDIHVPLVRDLTPLPPGLRDNNRFNERLERLT